MSYLGMKFGQAYAKLLRNRNITLLLISSALASFNFGFFYWFFPVLLNQIMDITSVGITYSLTGLFAVPSVFLGGVLADLYGRKIVILTGAGVYLLGVTLLLFPQPLTVSLGVIFILGMSSFARSAISALVAESVKSDYRGRAFSLISMMGLIASAIGSLILGAVTLFSIRMAVILSVVLSLIILMLRIGLKETLTSTEPERVGFSKVASNLRRLKEGFTTTSVSLLAFLTVIVAFAATMEDPYYSIFMNSILKLESYQIGIIFGLIPLGQALMQPLAGSFTDKAGPVASILLGNIGAGMAIIMFAVLREPFLSSLSVIISSSLIAFHNIGFNVLKVNAVEKKARATVFGGLEAVWSVSSIPAPTLGACLWNLSPEMPFIISGVLATAFAVITFLLRKFILNVKSINNSVYCET